MPNQEYKPSDIEEPLTLEELYSVITERIFPFVTFNVVDANENLICSNTISWCRFREMEDRPDLIEVRSNDCDSTPRQTLYMTKKIMNRYILTKEKDRIHYVFTYYTGVN